MVKSDRLVFRVHAIQRMFQRQISEDDVKHVLVTGQVIEDYPDDLRGPSCLIFGPTLTDRPLHIHCSHPSHPLVKIITLYEPNPNLWIDLKIRRASDED